MAWWRLQPGRRAGAGSDAHGAGADPRTVLTERVTFRAPATLTLRDSGRVATVRFAGLSDQEVRFDLTDASAPFPIDSLAACSVTFVHRRRAMVFLSQVRRVDEGPAEAPRQVALRLPSELASEDLRSAERIPNLRGSGIGIQIEDPAGGEWTSIPLNLSATGALVEFPEAAPRARAGRRAARRSRVR